MWSMHRWKATLSVLSSGAPVPQWGRYCNVTPRWNPNSQIGIVRHYHIFLSFFFFFSFFSMTWVIRSKCHGCLILLKKTCLWRHCILLQWAQIQVHKTISLISFEFLPHCMRSLGEDLEIKAGRSQSLDSLVWCSTWSYFKAGHGNKYQTQSFLTVGRRIPVNTF